LQDKAIKILFLVGFKSNNFPIIQIL
jgi:hypothetical protein